MTIEDAYKIYTVLRLHFTTDNYDIRSGIPPKSPKNGIRKNIQQGLDRILRKYNYNQEMYMEFLISNFIHGDNWGGLFTPEGDDVYMEWKKVQDSLSYVFRQEVEHLSIHHSEIHELWNCSNGHPPILKFYCGKKCCIETLVILNKLYRFRDRINDVLKNDPVWETINRLLYKYSPFINIDKEKFSMITSKVFA